MLSKHEICYLKGSLINDIYIIYRYIFFPYYRLIKYWHLFKYNICIFQRLKGLLNTDIYLSTIYVSSNVPNVTNMYILAILQVEKKVTA